MEYRHCKQWGIKPKKKIKKSNRKFEVGIKDEDKELYELLKGKRAEIAKKRNLPAFTIFHNATLAQIAAEKPVTKGEMLSIKGVGEKKFEDFGEAFLKVVNQLKNLF